MPQWWQIGCDLPGVERLEAKDTEEVVDGLAGDMEPLEVDLDVAPVLHSSVVWVVEVGWWAQYLAVDDEDNADLLFLLFLLLLWCGLDADEVSPDDVTNAAYVVQDVHSYSNYIHR